LTFYRRSYGSHWNKPAN